MEMMHAFLSSYALSDLQLCFSIPLLEDNMVGPLKSFQIPRYSDSVLHFNMPDLDESIGCVCPYINVY